MHKKEKSHANAPNMATTGIMIEKWMLPKLAELAKKTHRSRNKLIEMLLQEGIDRMNRQTESAEVQHHPNENRSRSSSTTANASTALIIETPAHEHKSGSKKKA